jgi:DNA-binding MarR family transcriptional regulator
VATWGAAPIALLQDSNVKPNMLKVYIALSSFQGRGDKAWPSIHEIAQRAGIPRSSVSEATEELVETGWVEKRRRANQRKTNVYSVLMEGEVVEEEDADVSENSTEDESRNPENPEIARNPENPEIPRENNRENNKGRGEPPGSLTKRILEYCEHQHGSQFTAYDKEGAQAKRIAQRAQRESPDEPERWLERIFYAFYQRRHSDRWFRDRLTWQPSKIVSVLDTLVQDIQREEQQEQHLNAVLDEIYGGT